MVIFETGGDQIILRDERYYFGGEDGAPLSQYWEFERTKEDAERVVRSVIFHQTFS